jgi:hypothetical protein
MRGGFWLGSLICRLHRARGQPHFEWRANAETFKAVPTLTLTNESRSVHIQQRLVLNKGDIANYFRALRNIGNQQHSPPRVTASCPETLDLV